MGLCGVTEARSDRRGVHLTAARTQSPGDNPQPTIATGASGHPATAHRPTPDFFDLVQDMGSVIREEIRSL